MGDLDDWPEYPGARGSYQLSRRRIPTPPFTTDAMAPRIIRPYHWFTADHLIRISFLLRPCSDEVGELGPKAR